MRRNPVWDVVGSLEIPLDGNSPENSPKSPIVNRNLILWVALHLQYYKDGQRVQTKSSAGYTPEYQVVGIKVSGESKGKKNSSEKADRQRAFGTGKTRLEPTKTSSNVFHASERSW